MRLRFYNQRNAGNRIYETRYLNFTNQRQKGREDVSPTHWQHKGKENISTIREEAGTMDDDQLTAEEVLAIALYHELLREV